MHSFSYNISGKVLRDLEQWNCNLASQSQRAINRFIETLLYAQLLVYFMREALSAFPLLPWSLSSLYIKLTNKTMQVLRGKKKKKKKETLSTWHCSDLIINIILPAIIYFQRKSLFSKIRKTPSVVLLQGLQGSTNKTKQLIQSLWWQHFGFLAIIAFHSTGANSYNRRRCLYATAFCCYGKYSSPSCIFQKSKLPRMYIDFVGLAG